MTVGLILAFVTMLSVLAVPIMISGGSPTMMTDKLPPTYGPRYWGGLFKPTSDAFASPGTSIVIASLLSSSVYSPCRRTTRSAAARRRDAA